MALNFPNVSVLGINQNTRFFDAGFQFSTSKRLSIAGTINDLIVGFGITGIWTGQEGVLETIRNNNNYQPLILNGTNFGSGRIENITFAQGQDVRIKTYEANISVLESGNLFNFTGEYYSGIQTDNFQYLQQFSESYSFNKKLNGGYSYVHSASIQFTSGVGQLNSIASAQSLAKTLFTGSNLGFAFYPGFTDKQGKRYVSEAYNLISNECSFQETFDFDNNNGNYSAVYNLSVQLDQEGIVTASEQGNIQGIENPNYQKALSAINTEMTGSYYRCSGMVNSYFPSGAILITSPTSQGRSIDIFNNNINYVVTFNNAINNRQSYFWDYSLEVNKQNGVSTVTEQGNVLGRGENPTTSYNLASNGFVTVKNGIAGRCGALFVGNYAPATNYLEAKQEGYSPTKGAINYSYTYSNDPTLISNNGIRRKNVTIEDNDPVYSFNQIGIINNATILQNNYQSSQGAQTVSVQVEGDKTVGLSTFLASAMSTINSNQPAGNDIYVGNASYTYDINQNAANVQLTWLYNRAAQPTSYP